MACCWYHNILHKSAQKEQPPGGFPAGSSSHPCSPTPAEQPAKCQGDSPIQNSTCPLALACNHEFAAWAGERLDSPGAGACRMLWASQGLNPQGDYTSSLSQERQAASSTLAAYRVSFYPDSSDRNLGDDWTLKFTLPCVENQSCGKHSALLDSLWLNKTCEEFGRC